MTEPTENTPPETMSQERPPLAEPAVLLATWFGSGWLKPAPGTWGTLAALPFAWNIMTYFGQMGLWIATAVIFLVGIWASNVYCKITNTHDSGEIVIDEVAGMWFTLCLLPQHWGVYAIAFVFFRFFDIVKPYPIRTIDRRVKGGLGVMLDDMVAAPMAMLCTAVTIILLQHKGWLT